MTLQSLCRSIVSPHRMARSHGYGVHSPFAYRFIREVISQPYSYYAYEEIDRLARSRGTSRRVLRALYRVLIEMQHDGVEVCVPMIPGVGEVMSIAGAENKQSHVSAFVGLYDGVSLIEDMWTRAEHGMLFMAPEMAVYIAFGHLPKQRFDIVIP